MVILLERAPVLKIQKALEEAGIRFTEDDAGEIGVLLKKEPDGPGGRLRRPPQHGKRS
jgi:hypothetical protein